MQMDVRESWIMRLPTPQHRSTGAIRARTAEIRPRRTSSQIVAPGQNDDDMSQCVSMSSRRNCFCTIRLQDSAYRLPAAFLLLWPASACMKHPNIRHHSFARLDLPLPCLAQAEKLVVALQNDSELLQGFALRTHEQKVPPIPSPAAALSPLRRIAPKWPGRRWASSGLRTGAA